MVDFASCYFCGTAEEPLEEYPVVPESLEPPPDAQRTVLVCAACAGKLDRVLEPVVDFLDAGDARASPSSRDDPSTRDDRPGDDGRAEGAGESPGPSRNAGGGPKRGTRTPTDPTPGIDDPESAGGEDRGLPTEANKVVRFLRNREFPVEREEAVTLASNAYGLGRGEVEGVIDALVERGDLAEEGGRLVRGGGE